MQQNVADFLYARALAAGGFTYCTRTGTFPAQGYAVAVSKAYERKLDTLSPEAIAEFYNEHARQCEGVNHVYAPGTACLGAWYHEGEWYLDLSIVHPDRDTAIALGAARQQLAVYDLALGESIPCAA